MTASLDTNPENGGRVLYRFEGDTAPVPEPTTVLLFCTALVGVLVRVRTTCEGKRVRFARMADP
jgi:PEP-CTERM motif